MIKSIFASKTFWVGVLEIAFGGVGFLFHWLDQQTAWALVVSGLAAVGLRFNTSQPVSLSGKNPPSNQGSISP